jgi:hypothetical protein
VAAGYSKRSLAEKLGIRASTRVAILSPPADYETTLGALPDGLQASATLEGRFDLIQFFTRSSAELEGRFPELRAALKQTGALWISWPKQAAKIPTDLNGTAVRAIGLANGLVDVKVCAVDATWSGLKFMVRLRDRTT